MASHSQLRIRTKLRFLSLSETQLCVLHSETCEQQVQVVQMVKELLDSDVCWGRRCIPMVRVFFGKSGAGFKTLQSSLHRGCRQSCATTTTTLRIHRCTKLYLSQYRTLHYNYNYKYNYNYITLHYTNYTTLHYTTLRYVTLH